MQGRYELMSTLHISNKGNRYVTIRAYQGEDVRIVSINNALPPEFHWTCKYEKRHVIDKVSYFL